jgi:hypothetical protein
MYVMELEINPIFIEMLTLTLHEVGSRGLKRRGR